MASSDCQKCGFMIIGKETEVPLKEIRTEVSIKGFIANVESKLEYFNKETTPIETEFVFPLDSKTAVYKFEAEINGRHIVAECQEKSQAYETYQDAVHSGHSAMLLSEEENAGDVFKLRLGNLDALSKAVLTFSYVVELDVEVHGTVRFTLPTVLCPRYTPAPELIDGSDQNRPVDGDGNQDKPVDGDGNQNRPVDGDGNQDRPVDGDGNQNRPIDGDGDQNRPVDGDGDQNRPVDGDGDQNRPVDGDGNQDKPVDGDGNQNRPTEVEPQEKKTPVLDSPDVITEYGSGQFKMSFSASVSGGYKINKIASKNDDFSVSLEGNKTDAKVSLKESFKHDHDLSFDIQYEDFDKPEIVLEKGIPDKGDFMKSDVLMLNFLPSWSADTEDMKCEFIFVIDRSGSMGGHRIQKAKEALLLMLKSLPMDCYFNIVSFGSDYSTLFQGNEITIEMINWHECFICQKGTKEKLRCPGLSKSGAGYSSFSKILNEFVEIGDVPKQLKCKEILKLNTCETDLSKILLDNNAKFHNSCRLHFSKSRLERSRSKTFEKDDDSDKSTRRSNIPRSSNKPGSCFFCGKTEGDLHLVSTFQLDKNVRRCATELNDSVLLAKLSAGDMISQDAVYHKKCLVSLYNKVRPSKRDDGNSQRYESENIALAELCAYIEDTRLESDTPVFTLSDLVRLYVRRLGQLNDDCAAIKVNSSHLKDKIIQHIPDLHAYKHGRNTLLAFNEDIGEALRGLEDNFEDDAFVLTKCASIIRRDLLKQKSHFQGNFSPDCQTVALPQSLRCLVGMILGGANIETQSLAKDEQSALSIAQLILFNYRSGRKTGPLTNHSTDREPPLPVYLGMKIHAETRKKGLVDTLYSLGLSISYDRLLSISTALGNSAIDQYEEDGVVCPRKLRSGVFTTSAVDNIDHNPSSTTSQGSLHGTAISVFQHPRPGSEGKLREREFSQEKLVTNDRTVSKLPDTYTTVPPVQYRKHPPLPLDYLEGLNVVRVDNINCLEGEKRSQKYSKKTQKEALSLQEKMDADMGGTEILKPLQNIYNTKLIKGYSRQIFLLTDGSVSNTQAVIKLIKDNAASTRVFTFGIGDGCSTELIRQGASVSQGAATFVKDTERLQTKVLSVLKKSTMNSISDLSVKFDLPSKVQHTMVPTDLPCLFKGEKLLLYTVLNGDTKARYDSSLTLSAVCGDQKISHKVSFDLSKVESSSGSAPLHRLAAKAQLELMELNIPEYIDTDPSMVTMSKATNIVCRYTAFVGVDKDSKVSIKSPTSDYYHDRDYNLDLCRRGKSAHLCSAGLMSYDLSSQQLCPAKMYKKKRGFGGFKFPSPFTSVMNFFRSSAPRESVESAVLSANRTAVEESKSASNPRGFSLRKKHMHRSRHVESLGVCMDSAPCDIQASLEECSLDEEDDDDIASRLQELQGLDTPNKSTEKKSKQEDRMIDLVTKQTFEGFWELDEGLASILGKTVKELHDKCPVKDMRVWATVLALAHLQMKYNKRKPEWQMIEEKATLWLFAQDLQGKKEEDLITEAKKVLS